MDLAPIKRSSASHGKADSTKLLKEADRSVNLKLEPFATQQVQGHTQQVEGHAQTSPPSGASDFSQFNADELQHAAEEGGLKAEVTEELQRRFKEYRQQYEGFDKFYENKDNDFLAECFYRKLSLFTPPRLIRRSPTTPAEGKLGGNTWSK